MNEVVIVAAARTPIGKFGGVFKTLNALELTIPLIQALVDRAGIDPSQIDDVVWGCNYQKTFRENNLARVAAVKAGLPVTVPGITLHRNCTSSMSAIQMAFYQIKSGEADMVMAGGTDSMSNAQYTMEKVRYGTRIGHTELRDSMWDSLTELGIGPAMGITAENLADQYRISRLAQDELALRSHERALAAMDAGHFKAEIVSVSVPGKGGTAINVDQDEHPRRDISLRSLERLKPSFLEQGTVTAGNASGINDGSAGVILMSAVKAREMGIPVMAKLLGTATAGVDPSVMGIGPVPAIHRVLEKCGLNLESMDLIELNEAFAAQYLACEAELGLDPLITNVNGSGVSLGHPVGASGARIVVTLIHEMKRRKSRFGLAALCAGGGMGTALVVEQAD
ncbi:MAG: thiolase family protein [Pseudomonadota bacterium]